MLCTALSVPAQHVPLHLCVVHVLLVKPSSPSVAQRSTHTRLSLMLLSSLKAEVSEVSSSSSTGVYLCKIINIFFLALNLNTVCFLFETKTYKATRA